MILLWLALAISMLLVSNIYSRIILAVVGMGVSAHVLSLRTLRVHDRRAAHGDQEQDD